MNRTQRKIAQFILWAGSIAIVIVVGMVYFPRDYPGISPIEALYDTLHLFVFERDQELFPHSWPLIAIHFAAPAITLSALGTVLSYLLHLSPALRIRLLRQHVIVAGVGRTGRLIAGAVQERGIPVVGVDLGPEEDFEERLETSRIHMLFGDFHSRRVMRLAGAARARSIVFASGDDLANLEGALGAYEWLRLRETEPRLLWVHIANERLAETSRSVLRTQGSVGIRIFDTYSMAARKMIELHFTRERREGIEEAVILGFGKFGRDLLDMLIRDLRPEEPLRFVVIDREDRSEAVEALAQELDCAERVRFRRGDLLNLDLRRMERDAFFLCTDDDLGNLTAAMELSERSQNVMIFVRMTRWPLAAVTEQLGTDRGVHFININDLMNRCIEDLPGVFAPAGWEDFKRAKLPPRAR